MVNERINKVESNSQKLQPPKAPNVQKRRNPYRYTNKDYYWEDLNEEDSALHINLSRIGLGNEKKKG